MNEPTSHVNMLSWQSGVDEHLGFKNAYDVNELVHTKICKTLQGHV
jgi:hypothetical protein